MKIIYLMAAGAATGKLVLNLDDFLVLCGIFGCVGHRCGGKSFEPVHMLVLSFVSDEPLRSLVIKITTSLI